MAKTIDNIFTEGLSGTVGNKMTLSQKAGETIVGRKRRASTTEATATQLGIQDKFKEATRYAAAVNKDPIVKAIYKAIARPNQSAYNIAFIDGFKDPEIKDVDTSEYHGAGGETIYIKADEFYVAQMKVEIHTAVGVLIEEGEAEVPATGVGWRYTTTNVNPNANGSKVTVTALNRPGKKAVKEAIVV
jgi:hypothetical protein